MTTITKSKAGRTCMVFAGVHTTLTPKGYVHKNAIVKILRSGRVRVMCEARYTDDYAADAANNYDRHELDQNEIAGKAADIENFGSGWHCWLNLEGGLTLMCHSFLTLVIRERTESWDDYSAKAKKRSDRWAATDRGWFYAGTGDSRITLGHYLDYGPNHYRSPESREAQPGNVHAVSCTSGSHYFETVAQAKAWIEAQPENRAVDAKTHQRA